MEVLVLCAFATVLPFVLGVGPGHHIHFKLAPDWLVPETCMSRLMFGLDCPGCGLTRSFVHLAHLRWNDAWNVHRLGLLMFVIVLIQFPYRIPALLRDRDFEFPRRPIKFFVRTVICMLIVNWLVGMAFYGQLGGN